MPAAHVTTERNTLLRHCVGNTARDTSRAHASPPMDPAAPEIFAQYALVAITSLAGLTGIGVAVHAYIRRVRRHDRRIGGAEAALALPDERLERIEQAVDAIAIEVERIAEGQRFLTKLQADRSEPRSLER